MSVTRLEDMEFPDGSTVAESLETARLPDGQLLKEAPAHNVVMANLARLALMLNVRAARGDAEALRDLKTLLDVLDAPKSAIDDVHDVLLRRELVHMSGESDEIASALLQRMRAIAN
jgi:hypothetical protein